MKHHLNGYKSAFLIAGLVLVTATTTLASDKSYEFKIVTTAGDRDSPRGRSVDLWADLIEEKSEGRMTADTFYQGELGGQQEVFDQLARGNVDMLIELPQTSYDERISILFLPYMFSDWEDAEAALTAGGWMDELIQPIFKDMGLKYFGPYSDGFTGFATKDEYVTNYQDAKESGIKLRTIPVFPIPQTVRAMGFQAVPIDWNEVYTSIQTGVVDGDSGNVIYWDYEYFGDLLDYYVQNKHRFSFSTLLMSDAVWSDLDEEDKRIVQDAAQEVIDKQFEDAQAEDEKWVETAQEGGMEYIVPTDSEIAEWAEVVRSEVWPEAEDIIGKELMDKVRANVEGQ